MARLAPPIIEGTVPAFCTIEGTTQIVVPFAMNRAVSREQVLGFKLKIKTIASSTYLATINGVANWGNMSIVFSIDPSLLNEGQFYKIQVAYVGTDGEIGYYSAVSVIKYTTYPTIEIQGLDPRSINRHSQTYVGSYEQDISGDITEKVYKYSFTIYDNNKNIFITSGEQIHNSTNDVAVNHSYDVFECPYELIFGNIYYIQYTITTINDLVLSSRKYRIQQKSSIEPNLNASIEPVLNYENGYISVQLNPKRENGEPIGSNGAFILSRACQDTNFTEWEILKKLRYSNETAQGEIFKDFTVQQGKKYIYGIAQYSDDGIFSNRKTSPEIYSDFEDMFLYDGKKQLKIRFNPQVASFKADILEQKVDTIGSKYPFIFRNGRVNYKDFPIGGLISYLADEEQLFMTNEQLGLALDMQLRKTSPGNPLDSYNMRSTTIEAYNVMAEREFKLKVLEWLNDGNLKLFRSPTEGNYIVRIVNSILSPNAAVGRMVHSFSSQAYEMAECTYSNLAKAGIIDPGNDEKSVLKWAYVNTANLLNRPDLIEQKQLPDGSAVDYIKINEYALTTLSLEGLIPGTIIYLDNEPIVIGATGAYYLDETISVNSVYLPADALQQGAAGISTVYSYYDKIYNVFDNISSIELATIPTRQFMNGEDIIESLTKLKSEEGKIIDNIKEQLSAINRISFYLKEGIGQKLYLKDGTEDYYTKLVQEASDSNDSEKYVFDIQLMNPYYSYPVYGSTKIKGEYPFLGYLVYLDGKFVLKEGKEKLEDESWVKIVSSNEENPTEEIIQLNDTMYFTTEFFGSSIPQKIQLGANVYAEVVYTSNIVSYKVEDDIAINKAKQKWEQTKEDLEDYRQSLTLDSTDAEIELLDIKRKNVNNAYFNFILELNKALSKGE